MAAPKYQIGDVIYIKASAQIGHLESFKITEILQVKKTRWLYRVAISSNPPISQTVGDRNSLKHGGTLVFDESDLLTFCEAQIIIVQNLELRLLTAKAKLKTYCEQPGSGSDN